MGWGENSRFSLSFFDALTLDSVPPEEQRAISLLSKCISQAELDEYLHTGKLLSVGQLTGNIYTLEVNSGITDSDGNFYCIHSPYSNRLPPSDDVLTWYLLIRFNENLLLDIANKRERDSDWLGEREHEIQRIRLIENITVECIEAPTITPARRRRLNSAENLIDATILDLTIDASVDIESVAYNYVPRNDMHQELEGWPQSIPLITDAFGRRISPGIAAYCLEVDDSPPNYGNMWRINDKIVNAARWPHLRSFDNAFLFALLSNYGQVINLRPSTNATKIILSSQSYEILTGEQLNDFLPEYKEMKVIIDDRVGDFVFTIPDARCLGIIVGDITENVLGFGILHPRNIRAFYRTRDNKFTPVNYELCSEAVYGAFIENDYIPIQYDIANFGRNRR